MPEPLEPTRAAPAPLDLSASAPAFVPARADRVGRFAVRAVLGEGAFGTVYLAHDPDLDRDVALKVPHPGALEPGHRDRFVREARAAAAIHHPNVCPVYEVSTTGDVPFLVMYHVAGPTLAGFLDARPGPLPVPLALALAHKLALGVGAAHDRGVTHRDLKPGNVLCDPATGEVLVTDFGLARLAAGSHSTADGAVLGTPAYMSPEQARGRQNEVGPASDVYALGAILYRLLTGDVPFRGSVFEVLAQHAEAPAPAPSASRADLDVRLDALCTKALTKEAKERYPHARAFADALAALAHQLGADLAARLPFEAPGATVVRPAPPTLPPGLQSTTAPLASSARAPTGRTGRFVALLLVLTTTVGALALFWPELRAKFARRPPPPPVAAQVEVAPMPRAKGAPPPPVPVEPVAHDPKKIFGAWEDRQTGTVWTFRADGKFLRRSASGSPFDSWLDFNFDGTVLTYSTPTKPKPGEPAKVLVTRYDVPRLTDDELELRRANTSTLSVLKRVPETRLFAELLIGVWEREPGPKAPPKGAQRWEFTRDGTHIATGGGAPVAQAYTLEERTIRTPKSALGTIVRLTETELVVNSLGTEWTFRRVPAKDKVRSAKDVMLALHHNNGLMKSLEEAVLKPNWPAARAGADNFADLAAALAKSAPPKGSAASWDKLTGAHLQAARDLLGATAAQDAAKARIHLHTLQRSCAECHKVHQ